MLYIIGFSLIGLWVLGKVLHAIADIPSSSTTIIFPSEHSWGNARDDLLVPFYCSIHNGVVWIHNPQYPVHCPDCKPFFDDLEKDFTAPSSE